MKTSNAEYIKDIKDKKININMVNFGFERDTDDETGESSKFYEFLQQPNNREVVYRYINDNVKSDIDFSKYKLDEIACFTIWKNKSYNIFMPKDNAYSLLFKKINKYIEEQGGISKIEAID
jgi:hypothetical protein